MGKKIPALIKEQEKFVIALDFAKLPQILGGERFMCSMTLCKNIHKIFYSNVQLLEMTYCG